MVGERGEFYRPASPASREALWLDRSSARSAAAIHRVDPSTESRSHAASRVRLAIDLQVLAGGRLPGEIPPHAVPTDLEKRSRIRIQTERSLDGAEERFRTIALEHEARAVVRAGTRPHGGHGVREAPGRPHHGNGAVPH